VAERIILINQGKYHGLEEKFPVLGSWVAELKKKKAQRAKQVRTWEAVLLGKDYTDGLARIGEIVRRGRGTGKRRVHSERSAQKNDRNGLRGKTFSGGRWEGRIKLYTNPCKNGEINLRGQRDWRCRVTHKSGKETVCPERIAKHTENPSQTGICQAYSGKVGVSTSSMELKTSDQRKDFSLKKEGGKQGFLYF